MCARRLYPAFSGGQVLDLLAREASLMRDRQTLAREVEFLRRHLSSTDMCRMERNVATEMTAVSEILTDVRSEHEKQIKEEVNEEVKVMQDFAHMSSSPRLASSTLRVKETGVMGGTSDAGSVYSEDFEQSQSD